MGPEIDLKVGCWVLSIDLSHFHSAQKLAVVVGSYIRGGAVDVDKISSLN